MTALLLTAVAVFAASWAGSGTMMRWLSRRMILDHPVERSSHVRPVPKGSGVAVTTALLAAWVALTIAGRVPPETLLICCLGFALAAISWFNDVTSLPAVLRLAVHLLIVTVGLLALPDRGHVFQNLLPETIDQAATVLLWAWFLNLFNFMDGIDGITAIETSTIGFGLAFVAAVTGVASGGYLLLWWRSPRRGSAFCPGIGTPPGSSWAMTAACPSASPPGGSCCSWRARAIGPRRCSSRSTTSQMPPSPCCAGSSRERTSGARTAAIFTSVPSAPTAITGRSCWRS